VRYAPAVLFLILAVAAVCWAFVPVRRKSRDEMTMGPEWLADFHRREHHREDV
jgi:cbb3-type cytochrome oxidase subunit 3